MTFLTGSVAWESDAVAPLLEKEWEMIGTGVMIGAVHAFEALSCT